MMKIIRLAICFLMAAVSALMSLANLLILTDADRLANDPREEWQLIVFTGVFILIFVIASYLFVVQLRRLINEQKINREDK
jgi:ABC-type dipeptide/oligopeptide/nickel transport system permease subunit